MAKFRFLFPFQGPVKSISKSLWQQEEPCLLPCHHTKGEIKAFLQINAPHARGLFMKSHKYLNIPDYGL